MKAELDIDPDVVIDGEGAVLGRLASSVASDVMEGESVVVVNAEDIVVSGEKQDVVDRYGKKARELGSDKGPYHPMRPDGIAKRSVRGMVPYKKKTGKEALKNLRFYVGEPEGLESDPREFTSTVDDIGRGGYVSLGEVSEKIGGNVTW